MQIEVTEADCLNSNINCHTLCPLAKAIRRIRGWSVGVANQTVQVFTKNGRTWVELNGKYWRDADSDPKVPCTVTLKEIVKQ